MTPGAPPISYDQLVDLVREMRAAQTRYFRTRAPKDLAHSKALEKSVDAAVSGEPRQGKLL